MRQEKLWIGDVNRWKISHIKDKEEEECTKVNTKWMEYLDEFELWNIDRENLLMEKVKRYIEENRKKRITKVSSEKRVIFQTKEEEVSISEDECKDPSEFRKKRTLKSSSNKIIILPDVEEENSIREEEIMDLERFIQIPEKVEKVELNDIPTKEEREKIDGPDIIHIPRCTKDVEENELPVQEEENSTKEKK
jgi:hypothetical protein